MNLISYTTLWHSIRSQATRRQCSRPCRREEDLQRTHRGGIQPRPAGPEHLRSGILGAGLRDRSPAHEALWRRQHPGVAHRDPMIQDYSAAGPMEVTMAGKSRRATLVLTVGQRATLEELARSGTAPAREAERARILVRHADGATMAGPSQGRCAGHCQAVAGELKRATAVPAPKKNLARRKMRHAR